MKIIKVLILLIGMVMLVGGGGCALMMVVNSVGNWSDPYFSAMFMVMLISIAVAVAGWFLVKIARNMFKNK